tara:strand:+ start:768 stop:983 length:216 start_codon:yes stop_codon:yes gene_type:complete
MNKDKIQIGDLVTHRWPHWATDVGLVIDDRGMGKYHLRYGVYWLSAKPPLLDFHQAKNLIKLSPTQEKENE